jgi:capsular exopolysaccharide synthesis family protein
MNIGDQREHGSEVPLREYLAGLRRRKWVAIGVALVVAATALLFSWQQRPVYQANAELLLQPSGTATLLDPGSGQDSMTQTAIQTEIRVLSSRPVRDAVQAKLGPSQMVSARQVENTQVVQVRARSRGPSRAAALANAYAIAYIDFRRTQAVEGLLAAAEKVQAKINDLQSRGAMLDARIPQLADRQVATAADQQLIDQRNGLLQQQLTYRERLDRVQLDASLKNGGAQLVTPASPPKAPVEPKPLRSLALGSAVGLVLGACLALVLDHFDDRITSREDVDRAIRGLAVTAQIPEVPSRAIRSHPILVTADTPTAAAEAYRSLRTTLQFIGPRDAVRTLQVTSPGPHDGKTTIVANLGVAMAEAGRRVVMVSCDLRRPRLHELLGLGNDVGLTSVLLHGVPLSEALQQVPEHGQLSVLTSGPPVFNPSELLSSRGAPQVLAALREMADVVLVDGPPVLPVTDSALLAAMVDATLLVARAGSTTRRDLVRTAEMLSQVDARVLGTILNGVVSTGTYGYAYRYAYVDGASKNGERRKTPGPGQTGHRRSRRRDAVPNASRTRATT